MKADDIDIEALTQGAAEPDAAGLSRILTEAEGLKGLPLEAAASLLAVKDPAMLALICKKAGEIKKKIFSNRIVLFAPLYLSNRCINSCLYCGFRSANREALRRALTPIEAAREAALLTAMGFKRVLLVSGEDPLGGLDYMISCIRAIYKKTGMRIIHVNAAPMEADELKALKKEGVGVYQVFQETYHRTTYELMHPAGSKKDYDYRLGAMDRAIEAGFEDVGIGALLGLYDHRYDALAAIAHSKRLFENYGTHAHTISVPRLRPAYGSALDAAHVERYKVVDDEFKKIVAVYRLSVPTAGVVVSTREGAGLRDFLVNAGASQLSAASKTDPGGYGAGKEKAVEQFQTDDGRELMEVMAAIVRQGGLPSLCTSCYRSGRTGGGFTGIAATGGMKKFCEANAVLTLKEFILDGNSNGSKELLEEAIKAAVEAMEDDELRRVVLEKLKAVEDGKRDERV